MLINMLKYKCQLYGINVVCTEESYTSKSSFFDNDPIPVYGTEHTDVIFSGMRIHRGLYKTSASINLIINADVNGSLNILRKYLNVASDKIISVGSRGLVVRPYRISFC